MGGACDWSCDSPETCIVHLKPLGANLNGVGTLRGILKQPIVRIKQLTRKQEKKLPLWTSVIQPAWGGGGGEGGGEGEGEEGSERWVRGEG